MTPNAFVTRDGFTAFMLELQSALCISEPPKNRCICCGDHRKALTAISDSLPSHLHHLFFEGIRRACYPPPRIILSGIHSSIEGHLMFEELKSALTFVFLSAGGREAGKHRRS
jgi:hypothetical protein